MDAKVAQKQRKVFKAVFAQLKNYALAEKWMTLPNEVFGGLSPLQMISEGRSGKVLKTVQKFAKMEADREAAEKVKEQPSPVDPGTELESHPVGSIISDLPK